MSYYDDASLVLIPSGVKAAKVYSQKPTNGSGDFTFARASTATRTDASGVVESVASNVPRLDYMTATGALATCPMLEVEGQRTNSIRNSSMVGAVAGTPGTLPTNWGQNFGTGLTRTVVGTGTENGLPYVDVRFSGTSSDTRVEILTESSSGISATTGQIWSTSVYVKIVSAPTPPNSYVLKSYYWNGGVNVNESNTSFTPTTTLARYAAAHTIPAGTITHISQAIRMNLTNGVTYDFTIRIAAPQMELANFSSTWIPTTAATVTRIKDDVSISGASALIGQTEGTIFLDVDFRSVFFGGIRVFFALEGSVSNQFSGLTAGTSSNNNDIQYAGVTHNLTQGRHKIVCTYNSTTNQRKLFVDGAQRGSTGTSAAFLATVDRISVLGRVNPFNAFAVDRQQFGGCNQFALWKTALSDAQCIQLSTL